MLNRIFLSRHTKTLSKTMKRKIIKLIIMYQKGEKRSVTVEPFREQSLQ